MTTFSTAARIAWLALTERASALSEPALPAWESLDAAAQARLTTDAEIACSTTSVLGEYAGQWLASRAADGWVHGAEDFAAKTSPIITDVSALTDAQVARITLWHAVCRAYWRSLS